MLLIFPSQEVAEFSGNYAVKIIEEPAISEKTIKIIAKIENHPIENFAPHALLYIKNDSAARNLALHDRLLVTTTFSPIAPPRNPYMFDYQSYMKRKGVLYSSYIAPHTWILLEKNPTFTIHAFARKIQRHFSDIFAQNGVTGTEYAVITAILLGNDDTMEADLRSQYAAAGVSHILCVSGMHVGIIFMILNFLLKPLDFSRTTRLLKSLLLLLAVWSYATITGLSPSVQRAATMFTFVTIGSILHRNANIFHSLFASLFILLLINPLLIFEIGFEMSYLAVFGIVIFQPKIAAVFEPKSKIIKYFWELISVSVAAQLLTFPLSIYYFGQFPNYFLLANLSVISLSFIIVVSGVILLTLSFVPLLAKLVGWVLSREILWMNTIIQTIESLPYSTTDQIAVNFVQVVLFYGIIFAIFLYFKRRTIFLKFTSLSLIIILLSSFCFDKILKAKQNEITFYAIDKMSVVGINEGGKGTLLLDSVARSSTQWYDFNVKNHERHQRIVSQFVSIDSVCSNGNFFLANRHLYMGNQHLYFLDKTTQLYPEKNPTHIDYLYVRNNVKIPLWKVLQTFDVENVIVDGSQTNYYAKRWQDSCAHYGIPFYSLKEKGYLTIHTKF